jgi:hypothetical protein
MPDRRSLTIGHHTLTPMAKGRAEPIGIPIRPAQLEGSARNADRASHINADRPPQPPSPWLLEGLVRRLPIGYDASVIGQHHSHQANPGDEGPTAVGPIAN